METYKSYSILGTLQGVHSKYEKRQANSTEDTFNGFQEGEGENI